MSRQQAEGGFASLEQTLTKDPGLAFKTGVSRG